MYRVLAPGGKAIVVSYSKPAFEGIFLRNGVDKEMVETLIAQKLRSLPNYPSQDQVNNAFQDLYDVIQTAFILDQNGKLQWVNSADKLSNEQAIWSKTQIMTFATISMMTNSYNNKSRLPGSSLTTLKVTTPRRGELLTTVATLKLSWIRQLQTLHLLLCIICQSWQIAKIDNFNNKL